MESMFLRELPTVSLAEGKTKAFIADFPEEARPSFEHAKIWVEKWRAQVVEKVTRAMKRKTCAVSCIQIVVDQHGFLVIACFNHPVILSTAKTAVGAIFRCMPKEATYGTAEDNLRPLDEVDADRIRGWQTVTTLRPKGKKRDREESDSEPERVVKPKQELQLVNKSAALLLAEMSDSSSEEEEVQPPHLTLTNGPAERLAERPENETVDLLDHTSVWVHRVKTEAVLVVAEVGSPSTELQYRHCHHESRRQLLIQNRVRNQYDTPGMVQVMRMAMRLAQNGSLPGPGDHGRKSEFVKTCATVLQALDPTRETDIKKLSPREQSIIRSILGGDTSVPYEGCLSQECMDEKTAWVVDKVTLPGESSITVSRCAKCNFPKAFGRTVHGAGDLFRTRITRDTLAGK